MNSVEVGWRWHSARKLHRCDECARDVAPGERYRRSAIVGEGGACTIRHCVHCDAMRKRACVLARAAGVGVDDESSVESLLDYLADCDAEHDEPTMLLAGRSAKWTLPDGSLMPVPELPDGREGSRG